MLIINIKIYGKQTFWNKKEICGEGFLPGAPNIYFQAPIEIKMIFLES